VSPCAERRGPGRPRSESIDSALLEAMLEELIEKGFVAASMESVAARACVAKTTLYRRYPNLTDLAVDALSTFEEVVEEPPDGTVREQFLWLLDGMRRKWSNPRYAAVMRRVVADATVEPETYRAARDRLVGPVVRASNTVIRRAMDEGLIRSDVDLDFVRQLLVSPIMAAALTLRPRITRAQVELTVDTVLAGLAPGAE
jgi:AcrR family transcriptional regulator